MGATYSRLLDKCKIYITEKGSIIQTRRMATTVTPTSAHAQQVVTPRKRTRDDLMSPESKRELFPVFDINHSPSKSRGFSKSPSSSPSRKKANLTLKQGACQNNKIVKYLQPKRLLRSFENHDTKSAGPSISVRNIEEDGKENKFMDLKVTLFRVEDALTNCSYCLKHNLPIKYCCNAASEFVLHSLEDIINKNSREPCKRLGIPIPACVSSSGCTHNKIIGISSCQQDTSYATMSNSGLKIAMIRSAYNKLCKQTYPSSSTVHSIFKIMKESADQRTVGLGRSFLKRTLDCFPPCTPKLRSNYIHILHSSEKMVNIPSGLWGLRALDFFEENLSELEKHIEGLLNPSQLKDKMKMPCGRKKRKPKRFRDSPSPKKRPHRKVPKEEKVVVCEDTEIVDIDLENYQDTAVKERALAEKALRDMSTEKKSCHIFSRFEILVDILERDLVVWLSRNEDFSKIRDRTTCPLIVLALWKPESDTGFDSVHCRRIFSLYSSAWLLKFHPHHLKILSRLIGLIAEITSASEPNFANVYPHIGEGCENLARKLCDALMNCQMEETKTKAIAILKPEWLKMLVSAKILQVSPTTSSVDMSTLYGPMSTSTVHLWACFLEAVIEFYHVKDAMNLLKQASSGSFSGFTSSKGRTQNRHGLNYKGLLREIQAYYYICLQTNRNPNSAAVPYLLREIFTL